MSEKEQLQHQLRDKYNSFYINKKKTDEESHKQYRIDKLNGIIIDLNNAASKGKNCVSIPCKDDFFQ